METIGNIKMGKNGYKNVCIKNRTCYYFDDLIKLKDFDFDNILIEEKFHDFFYI